MSSMLRKVAIAAVAALTMGAGVTATATPSAAHGWYGHGWHGGGWHGGGWGWHRGYWGGGWGGPVAADVLGGLALGALAGSAYAYGPAPITAAATGRTRWPTTPGAILPATSPSKSAIDFCPVA